MPFEDLIQEGSVGLVEAITKFDLSKQANGKPLALSTYATWWIRQAITRAIDNKSRAIRIPIHKLNEARAVSKEYSKFRIEYQEEPTPEELEIIINDAAKQDTRVKATTSAEIQFLMFMLNPIISLDYPNSEDENLTILDYISDNELEQPEQKVEVVFNQDLCNALLAYLDEEERAFILFKFGLVDGKERDKKGMMASMRWL